MILSNKQKGIIKDFIGVIQYLPLPMENQERVGTDKRRWCSDWWTIEVLKCLYWTADSYRLDPPPNRLKNNPDFAGGIEGMIEEAAVKLRMMDHLETVKDRADTLYVCEACRGIDILLAYMIKDWPKVIAYDKNEYYVELLPKHFPGKNIEVFKANSGELDWKTCILEPVVLISDNDKLGDVNKRIIPNNPNVKAAIIEGVLLK